MAVEKGTYVRFLEPIRKVERQDVLIPNRTMEDHPLIDETGLKVERHGRQIPGVDGKHQLADTGPVLPYPGNSQAYRRLAKAQSLAVAVNSKAVQANRFARCPNGQRSIFAQDKEADSVIACNHRKGVLAVWIPAELQSVEDRVHGSGKLLLLRIENKLLDRRPPVNRYGAQKDTIRAWSGGRCGPTDMPNRS